MRLDLPFLYRARIIRPRCRNEEHLILLATESFDILEVEAARAPLVCVAQARLPRQDGYWNQPRLHPIEYRRIGDQLLKPLSLDLGPIAAAGREGLHHAPWDLVTAAALPELLEAWRHRVLNPDVDNSFKPKQHLATLPVIFGQGAKAEAEVVARQWLWDDRAETLEGLRAAADRCAVIDGQLWVPSDGPCYVVATEHRGNRWETVLVTEPELARHAPVSPKTVFTPDRLDAARQAVAARAATHYPEGEPIGGIEIRDRLAFHRDPVAEAIVRAGNSLLSQIQADLFKMPTRAMRTCADLRDALDTCGRRPDRLAADAVLMLADDLNDQWTVFHKNVVPRGDNNPLAMLRAAMGQPHRPIAAAPARRGPPDAELDGAVAIDAAELHRLGLA